MAKKQPLYPHVPKSRPDLRYEELLVDGYELRHVIKVGTNYIVVERETLAPILSWVSIHYFDVTVILDQLYRPPFGMGEYCMVKVWPKPSRIMTKKGNPLEVETLSDLRVYFQVSLGEGPKITPDLDYSSKQ